ncbi:O-linked N-acetylglucosamine transferase, SPINDLY family protein [Selenomonas sputigena]|uniref:Tetratricopeptide repeat protein n=1 Tax=Selenomonas sputigena (strain ATCC 35185 / DSM 20758 / CCUG 44933 / VPI D19B-28) TaxID=546271 RepID=C9LSM8_SELS3|nr:hypothetical protein [Selenomonas sputigena]AEC00664.1 hypothetical protein Selsp_1708 [Selenomonas sputigena ATCC 35185]EEX78268.1 tetratricopeptide repeat protein [Selenomonas sputigena ATCC 35185]
MDDKENWIGIANRFANQGDFRGMRASAKEILQIVPEDADAYAIMAEASFYMDERESAKEYIARAEEREPGNLRARLVRAAFFSADFALEEEIKELLSIVQATEKVAESLWTQSLRYVRFKALAWLSDAWLLAAEPEFAMNTLLAASDMLTGEEAAECYSKALFCSNYRTRTPAESLRLHRGYEKFFEGVKICHPYRTEAAEAGALQPKAALSVGEAMAAARSEADHERRGAALVAQQAKQEREPLSRLAQKALPKPQNEDSLRLWAWEARANQRRMEEEKEYEAFKKELEEERRSKERREARAASLFSGARLSLSPAQRTQPAVRIQPTAPPMEKRRTRTFSRKLRIGYISPDFRLHAAAYFFMPLVRDFDAASFEVTCYARGKRDRVTSLFRQKGVRWKDISRLSARDAARLIERDGIDILVDLAGHTQGSGLPVLARRPAPVQLTAIGYMATTGLRAVDYFLSDIYCSPWDMGARGFSEKVLRMPHSHLCYVPVLRDMPKSGGEAPFVRNGYITFGSFNNFSKVSDDMLALWRGVLERMKGARLVVKSKICSIAAGRKIVKERLQRFGIPFAQVELRPYSPDYLEQYTDIDIALDTFPYTGGVTTCEALYMGVPVITKAGGTHGSRFSTSILENAGLSQLVARGDMEYVRKAVELADSPDILCRLHRDLRARMETSPLMDVKGYMKDLEDIYREIADDV